MSGRVVVVGLGPAGPELWTGAAREALGGSAPRYLRTTHHPGAAAVAGATSFDHVYETAATREEVYATIADALAEAAACHGEVVYAVPGSPLVLERSVALLRDDDRVEVVVVPGLSFLDLAWARLGVDPVAAGVRLVDGEAFAVEAAGERGPLLVAQTWGRDVLSEVKLAVEDEPGAPVVVMARLGLPDEAVFEVPWADLDRAVDPDHLTSLFVPELAAPVGTELARLGQLIRTLRRRCPWDREQTHTSLRRHLVEETYEVLDAIDALDRSPGEAAYRDLAEELGDLLVQVYFHATLAAEAGQFNLADVARGVHDKLVGRHPHVFGDVQADTPDRVRANWEQIKRAEKGRASVMDGIPPSLPALLAATKVVGKAESTGADRRSSAAHLAALRQAVDHLAREAAGNGGGAGTAEEVGAALLVTVALTRRLGVDPEAALRDATAGYQRRFMALEARAQAAGGELGDASPAETDALWRGD
ncbi:MAG TPA: nucleoside triphosphate pyrophosphohydrolase [Acidimicrobiales bacterium]|nr:nucleoside triphosphate pyrophosphohydrolase [Acidimicrobiales bacterium]